MSRMMRLRSAIAAGIVLVIVVGAVGIWRQSGPGNITITADFAQAPGLYRSNHVEILGVPVGQIVKVTPHPDYVAVEMKIRDNVKVPRDVSADLEAPDVVNDRFVQLTPVYRGGPALAAGAVIPSSRTQVPISTDQILGNLDELVKDLGPTGANKNGAVAGAVAQLAKTLGGNGPALHKTVVSTGQALGALADDGPEVKSLLDNLAVFTKYAAADSSNYQAFVNDLDSVTGELAADDSDIGGALHNLQVALKDLAEFVATNHEALGSSVSNLNVLFSTLAKEQGQLAGVLTDAPKAVGNIADAIDPNAPGGPALRSRYDPTTGATTVTNQVCGNTLLRLLVVTQNPKQATPLDVVCGFSSVIENLGAPADSPTGPSTTLQTLAGTGS